MKANFINHNKIANTQQIKFGRGEIKTIIKPENPKDVNFKDGVFTAEIDGRQIEVQYLADYDYFSIATRSDKSTHLATFFVNGGALEASQTHNLGAKNDLSALEAIHALKRVESNIRERLRLKWCGVE